MSASYLQLLRRTTNFIGQVPVVPFASMAQYRFSARNVKSISTIRLQPRSASRVPGSLSKEEYGEDYSPFAAIE